MANNKAGSYRGMHLIRSYKMLFYAKLRLRRPKSDKSGEERVPHPSLDGTMKVTELQIEGIFS